jgi:hypothetical protein
MNESENLIRAMNEFSPNTLNGAVIFHIDKDTKKVISISPIIPVENSKDLFEYLSDCRNAIDHLLNKISGLSKN